MNLEAKHQAKLDEWLTVTQEIHDQLKDDGIEDGSNINLSISWNKMSSLNHNKTRY